MPLRRTHGQVNRRKRPNTISPLLVPKRWESEVLSERTRPWFALTAIGLLGVANAKLITTELAFAALGAIGLVPAILFALLKLGIATKKLVPVDETLQPSLLETGHPLRIGSSSRAAAEMRTPDEPKKVWFRSRLATNFADWATFAMTALGVALTLGYVGTSSDHPWGLGVGLACILLACGMNIVGRPAAWLMDQVRVLKRLNAGNDPAPPAR